MALAAPALAHPPVGIVRDRDGAIFYSDLENVWRIGPDGRRTVAVPGVHTHELHHDLERRLWGGLLETSLTNAVRVRRLARDGTETVWP